jgi:hypothetical protein
VASVTLHCLDGIRGNRWWIYWFNGGTERACLIYIEILKEKKFTVKV